jgi:hypothetical protein
MAAADFTAAASMAVVDFVAAAGEAAVGAGPDGAAAGVIGAQVGAGAVVGAAAVGVAAAGLGWWLGLGLGSGLGDRGGDRARRGRGRFAAGLWRRSGLLGQSARLNSQRPLSWPAACQHLLVTVCGPCRPMTVVQIKVSETIKRDLLS